MLGAWLTGCIVLAFFAGVAHPWSFLFSPYNILFLFGMAAAVNYHRLVPRAAIAALVIGIAVFLAIGLSDCLGYVHWNRALRTAGYGVGATLIVMALAANAIKPPRWLTFLGDASYSIYLTHTASMSFGVFLLLKLHAPWGLPLGAMLAVLMAVVASAGCAVHVAIEKPVIAMFRRPRAVAKSDLQG